MTNKLFIKLKIFFLLDTICLFLLLSIHVMILPSCKKYDNNVQVRRIYSLIRWNNNVTEMLIIDAPSIQTRTVSMKLKIMSIDSGIIKRAGDQLKSDMITYNGLLLKYKAFLDFYYDASFENARNTQYLAELKKKVIDHKLPVTNIDTILNNQETIIKTFVSTTQEFIESIFSIEEMYQRVNNRINPYCKNLDSTSKLK